MSNEYGWEVSALDVHVALDYEADRAKQEGMKGVEDRQRKEALHIRNATAHMAQLCPEGYRVRTRIVVDFVPSVNPFLRDDVRQGRTLD